MHIVRGSGNSRSVFVFPDSYFVKKSPETEQVAARNLLCNMLNINPEMETQPC